MFVIHRLVEVNFLLSTGVKVADPWGDLEDAVNIYVPTALA